MFAALATGIAVVALVLASICLYRQRRLEADLTAIDGDLGQIEDHARAAVKKAAKRIDDLAWAVIEARDTANWAADWVGLWITELQRRRQAPDR